MKDSNHIRVLVTGGSGFIGSHLCERLLNEGRDVLCVDNFYTGTKRNILHLLKNPFFELIRHDITFPLYVEADEIYNLACPAAPIHYQNDPVQTTKVNVHGSINMLGLAKRLKAKILQASTSEIYGNPTVHPQKETYLGSVNPIGPRACYDEGKRCAETLFFDYHRQHGIKIKVARIFNTYGPRMHPNDGRVVSNFVLQALRGEPITIYGEGSQTRSFCYVDDMVDGLIRLMESPDDFTPLESPAACSGDEPRKRPKVLRGEPPRGKVEDFLTGFTGPVNLGNPEEITILELAEKILNLTGSRSKILFKPLPPDDPERRQPDITLAKEKLGWAPKISLEEGLKRTIEYFSALLREELET